jgi:murein DD-endopeptidase MepM/ murein hydrolase activator NlpD
MGSVTTGANMSYAKVDLGVNFINPISGSITSRFGVLSSIRSSAHTGLDIGASIGTPIAAAASGTVTFSGKKGSYGYLITIDHGNGVLTYYAHCSALYKSVGEVVNQGDTIAAVGNTGNSTGPHLHIEVRVNGVAYNPQDYFNY